MGCTKISNVKIPHTLFCSLSLLQHAHTHTHTHTHTHSCPHSYTQIHTHFSRFIFSLLLLSFFMSLSLKVFSLFLAMMNLYLHHPLLTVFTIISLSLLTRKTHTHTHTFSPSNTYTLSHTSMGLFSKLVARTNASFVAQEMWKAFEDVSSGESFHKSKSSSASSTFSHILFSFLPFRKNFFANSGFYPD